MFIENLRCNRYCAWGFIYILTHLITTHKTKYVYYRYFTDGVTETWIGKLLAESDRVRLVMRAKLETWAAPSHSVLRTFIGSSIIPFAIIGTLGRGDARSKDQSQRYCKATESLLGQRPQRERIGWSKRRTSQQGTGGSSNPCGWQ